MEAAGAAATLLTLIGFTLQSLKIVCETTGSIRDGPPMLARLTIAGKELETVLNQLSKLAHDSQASQQSAEQEVWDALSQNIFHCRDDVLHLEKDVAALGVVKSDRLIQKVWKRVKTSLKDKDFERMWSTAQSHVGALKLQLSIIESRRNTAHESNAILRHDTVSDSVRDCVSQIQLHSDGIKAHVAEHTNNVRSSINNLNLQARDLANGPAQVLDALGAATQSIGSQVEASTVTSYQIAQGITQSLGSRLDGLSELSNSQYGTIIKLLKQIQETSDERLSSPMPDHPPRSPCPAREAGQECAGLLTSIERLGALASDSGVADNPEAAERVIQELELILDFLVKQAIARGPPVFGMKRKRTEDESNLAVTTRDVKKMKGLLSASQSIDMAQIGPHKKLNERRYAKVGSHYSRTVWDMQGCTAVISCISRPNKAAPHRQGFTPRNPVDCFEGSVTLRPKPGSSRKKLRLSFLQRFSSSGFTSLNPTLSFHALLPFDSAIFCAIELGDMNSMLGLLNDKEASLTDCDIEGRSLLSYATWHRQLDICRLLIDHGADVDSVELKMNSRNYHVCLLEQYGGNDFETAIDSPDEFNANLDMRQFLLRSGADPMVPSKAVRWDGVTQSVLWTILEDSTDEALTIFLRSGKPYIDLMAKDSEGQDALIFLLDCAVYHWDDRLKEIGIEEIYISEHTPDIRSKIATLLRHGANPRSQNHNAYSCLHICLGLYHPERIETDPRREMLECLCVLIESGADVHAVSLGRSVTETAHESRAGQLWEKALESCGFDVDQVYALDHNRDLKTSSDLYAPTDQRPRLRGPMAIQAYHDTCRKGTPGCATIHEWQRWSVNALKMWTGKCRWPNGIIYELHHSYDGLSDDSSSEQEGYHRARTCSDCSEYDEDTEGDSDEEMGGVPINPHTLDSVSSSLEASYTDIRPFSFERNGFTSEPSMHLGSEDIID